MQVSSARAFSWVLQRVEARQLRAGRRGVASGATQHGEVAYRLVVAVVRILVSAPRRSSPCRRGSSSKRVRPAFGSRLRSSAGLLADRSAPAFSALGAPGRRVARALCPPRVDFNQPLHNPAACSSTSCVTGSTPANPAALSAKSGFLFIFSPCFTRPGKKQSEPLPGLSLQFHADCKGYSVKQFLGLIVLSFLVACSGSGPGSDGGTGGGGGTTGGGAGGGTAAAGFRKITLPTDKQTLNFSGIYCTSATQCVATANISGIGYVYSMSDTAVGDLLVDGTYPGPVPTAADQLGDVTFVGIEKSRSGVIARAGASGVYVSAVGDITKAASWTVVKMGTSDGSNLGLNDQAQLVDVSGQWLFINEIGYVYSSPSAPGPAASWTKLWSPLASPAVPSDFATQFAADPTLCKSDVTAGAVPFVSNPAFVSQDGNMVVYPAGGMGQNGTASPGVCISTDKGRKFYSVPFMNAPATTNAGPHGVTCLDNNRCLAMHGLDFVENPYIYVTANAAMGKASIWTKATLPANISSSADVSLRAIFFAPNGQNGWCVGDNNNAPLLLKTTNGGTTWTDVSASVAGLASNQLYSGFAFDENHIWVVGKNGIALATSTAQQ